MFAGRAYREGFDRGGLDAHVGRDKQPRPSFWKGLVSRGSYAGEFNRGYRAGYELGCKGEEIARSRPSQASAAERHAELQQNRSPFRERDDESSR